MSLYSQIQNNKVKSYFIVFLFIGFISMVFYLLGVYYGDTSLYFLMGFIISIISGFGSYFYSDKIVLSMNKAKPADKKEWFDYYTSAENISIGAGIPMPKLYVIDDPTPNAFATGRSPKKASVAVTTGLLTRLDRSDIEGVIAHEMAHIKNYDTLLMMIVTVLVGTLVYAIDFAARSFWWGGGRRDSNSKSSAIGIVFIVLLFVVTPIIASLIQFAISRKREYLADATGVLFTRNPNGLADALEKISYYSTPLKNASSATAHLYITNPFGSQKSSKQFLTNLFSTHPSIEERIKILRAM